MESAGTWRERSGERRRRRRMRRDEQRELELGIQLVTKREEDQSLWSNVTNNGVRSTLGRDELGTERKYNERSLKLAKLVTFLAFSYVHFQF